MGVTARGRRRWLVGADVAGVGQPFIAPAVILAVQLVFFGMPLGLWLRGVVLGLLTALLAVGLVLVYRANRVVNFAQADLGSAPVAFAVGLIVFWGWSYWLGFASASSARSSSAPSSRSPSFGASAPHRASC